MFDLSFSKSFINKIFEKNFYWIHHTLVIFFSIFLKNLIFNFCVFFLLFTDQCVKFNFLFCSIVLIWNQQTAKRKWVSNSHWTNDVRSVWIDDGNSRHHHQITLRTQEHSERHWSSACGRDSMRFCVTSGISDLQSLFFIGSYSYNISRKVKTGFKVWLIYAFRDELFLLLSDGNYGI